MTKTPFQEAENTKEVFREGLRRGRPGASSVTEGAVPGPGSRALGEEHVGVFKCLNF